MVATTAGGIVYSVLMQDTSSGMAISTYAVGFFAVAGAIWGAGEHLGVDKPDAYSYSFDTVHGSEIAQSGKVLKVHVDTSKDG
jgi:hypothetical protein